MFKPKNATHSHVRAALAALVACVLLSLSVVGCGRDGVEDETPPPATIIRSGVPVGQPTPVPAVATSTPYPPPMPPQRPARPASSDQAAYPYPAQPAMPGPSPTPAVYPTG